MVDNNILGWLVGGCNSCTLAGVHENILAESDAGCGLPLHTWQLDEELCSVLAFAVDCVALTSLALSTLQ